MGIRFSSRTLEQYCHLHPGWLHMVAQIDSADKWNTLQEAMFADGQYTKSRSDVLHQCFADVLFNVHDCRGDLKLAIRICMAYGAWLESHPQCVLKGYNPSRPLAPLYDKEKNRKIIREKKWRSDHKMPVVALVLFTTPKVA